MEKPEKSRSKACWCAQHHWINQTQSHQKQRKREAKCFDHRHQASLRKPNPGDGSTINHLIMTAFFSIFCDRHHSEVVNPCDEHGYLAGQISTKAIRFMQIPTMLELFVKKTIVN